MCVTPCCPRPGGRCIFMEHIGGRPGSLLRMLQEALHPAWTLLTDGCHCNRNQRACIEKLPWAVLHGRVFQLPLLARLTLFPLVPSIYIGVAVKSVN